jgi:chromosomal replication initiator protein
MTNIDLPVLWTKVVPLLEKSLNKPIYETLLTSTKPIKISDGKLLIAVQNEPVKNWLSKHCITLLEQELKSLQPEIKKVEFIVGSPDIFTTPPVEKQTLSSEASALSHHPFLNPRYTFDTFVIGHGNRFAHAASLAVAEAPAKAYNPLFLYGGVGLGKTHLMQAIGHHVSAINKRSKILYITSETFTNELINAIRDDRTVPFRNKYRNIDILLVDDVQFLAGKERTQEEFFHTFNSLYEAGKQIVVSSDRPPKEIPNLEERMRSRFEWGLTADIQAPDYETRIAILRKKAELSEIAISNDILTYIAGKVISNIRELEGALIRVVAQASLNSMEISPQFVDTVLQDILAPTNASSSAIPIDFVKKATAEFFNLRVDDLAAKVRTKDIALARQVAMFLARELTGSSLPKIGDSFGGRDHTTVMHACEKIKVTLKNNQDLKEAIKSITAKVKSYAL